MFEIHAGSYQIVFREPGYATLNEYLAGQHFSKIFLLTDSNSHEFCGSRFLSMLETTADIEIVEIESGEQSKNIETCIQLWNTLIDLGADRKSLLINLGGGVVTDMGGFVAATFKRGIKFVNVPTTLLAMVDASIGGKNGVDLGNLKNQIGTITDPGLVLIDPEFLGSLPQAQLLSGLAEMLKHALIFDRQHWNTLVEVVESAGELTDELLFESISIKNQIVSQDRTEDGIRKSLNFGHTLGHAIESQSLGSTLLLHGEAVAAGMVLESYLSVEKGLLTPEDYLHIKNFLLSIFPVITFAENDIEEIIDLLSHDKKNEYGNIQFALLDGIGAVSINRKVDKELIIKAFKDYMS